MFTMIADVDHALEQPGALEDAAVLRDILQEAGLPLDCPLSEVRAERIPHAHGLGIETFVFDLALLGLPRARWTHRADLPGQWTHEFQALFWLAEDRRANLEAVLNLLPAALLGPLSSDDRFGCWRRRFGTLVQVEVSAPDETSVAGNNSMLTAHPELLEATTVFVRSPLRTTRQSPEVLVRALAAERLAIPTRVRASRTHLHLHPPNPVPFAWRDEGCLGVTGLHCSVVHPHVFEPRLDLLEIAPARGPGSATLTLTNGSAAFAVATSPDERGLRAVAKRHADALGVAVRTIHTENA